MADRLGQYNDRIAGAVPAKYIDMGDGTWALRAAVVSTGSSGGLTDAQLRATPVPVSGTFWQATQPVSGTFWQATQPVSGPLTDAQLRATPVAVTGGGGGTEYTEDVAAPADPLGGTKLFRRRDALVSEVTTDGDWVAPNATAKGEQYVKHVDSIAVTGTFWQAAQPVSGTFWQATQPVSGTFWQAAQPITDNAGSLTVDGVFWQATQPVSGTFWQTTQPVSLAAAVDVSDRAGRLVGVVYGSQAQQLKQTATNFNTATEVHVGAAAIDPRSIRALTAADIVTANGDVDHDAVNTLKNIQLAGHASPVDLPPTAVSAAGDRVRMWLDRSGSQVMRRRKIRESYTAVGRLAEAAARLDQTFTQVANTNKQWSTLHHAATATKEIKLERCWVYVTSDTVAAFQGVVELRELSVATAPVIGTGVAITGRPHRIGTGAHEATCFYLPTAGSEAAANSPLGHVPFDTGISGAVSTVNPVPILTPIVLFDASTEDDEIMPPTAPVGVYGGWAVVVRTVGAPVLRITVVWKFTEEIP